MFGLLGPNGAGKTTTIRKITILLPAPVGVIEVFGRDVAHHKLAVRRLMGCVPQQLSADADLTGRENMALFARLFDVPRARKAFAVAVRALVQALAVLGLAALLGVRLTANPLKLLAVVTVLILGSSALYPVDLMPGWLKVLNYINPLGYEVDALRGLLIGTPAQLALDFGILISTSAVMIGIASALLGRLAH